MNIATSFSEDNSATRQQIYDGQVFLVSGGKASRKLVAATLGLLEQVLETDDVRRAHLIHDDEELFARFGRLRRILYLEHEYHESVRAILADCGFDPDEVAFDPARLRVVLPNGHQNPRAAPVYFPHRDTWYAHPQALAVWWVPLHDLASEETFRFFPESFDSPVPNDSEIFDYADLDQGWARVEDRLAEEGQWHDCGLPARIGGTQFRKRVRFCSESG